MILLRQRNFTSRAKKLLALSEVYGKDTAKLIQAGKYKPGRGYRDAQETLVNWYRKPIPASRIPEEIKEARVLESTSGTVPLKERLANYKKFRKK